MEDDYEKFRKIISNLALLFFLSVDYFTGIAVSHGINLFQSLFIFIGPCVVDSIDYILFQKHKKRPMRNMEGYSNIMLLILSFMLIVFSIVAAFNNIEINDKIELMIKFTTLLYPLKLLETIIYYMI